MKRRQERDKQERNGKGTDKGNQMYISIHLYVTITTLLLFLPFDNAIQEHYFG